MGSEVLTLLRDEDPRSPRGPLGNILPRCQERKEAREETFQAFQTFHLLLCKAKCQADAHAKEIHQARERILCVWMGPDQVRLCVLQGWGEVVWVPLLLGPQQDGLCLVQEGVQPVWVKQELWPRLKVWKCLHKSQKYSNV